MNGNTEDILNTLHVLQVFQNQATFLVVDRSLQSKKFGNIPGIKRSIYQRWYIDMDAGRKANTMEEIAEAKSRLKNLGIIGTINLG